MPNLKIQLLGAPQIYLDNAPVRNFVTRKAQAVLIYLAATRQAQTRDALAGLFWPDLSDQQARNNLRRILPNLRTLVGTHLRIDRQLVSFDQTQPYSLDIETFAGTLRQLSTDATTENPSAEQVQIALDLYQGDFLEGFFVSDASEFETWALLQREQLRKLAKQGLDRLVESYLRTKQYDAALLITQRLLTIEPWHEATYYQQMLILAQLGQRIAALTQYERCRTMLAEEFGIQPSATLTILYEQLKAGENISEANGAGNDAIASVPTSTITLSTPSAPLADANAPARTSPSPTSLMNWAEVPRAASFYGRQTELNQLKIWLLHEQCALIVIQGTGGVGKTALATQLVRELGASTGDDPLYTGFARILWHSLLNASPLEVTLRLWLAELSDHQLTSLPATIDEQLSLLFRYIRQQRCLLVLDNMESILQVGESTGPYLPDYENYALLIQRMGELDHRSCLLLTSRELPPDVARLERTYPVVRSLRLDGLPIVPGVELLQAAGLKTELVTLQQLVQRYSGNPLALRLVAETVADDYDGNVGRFLQQETLIFEDIRLVLDQQFRRLSALEREIMFWLTIEREPVSIQKLALNFVKPIARHTLLEAIRSLHRRSLIEREHWVDWQSDDGEVMFALQNVVLEYGIECIRQRIGAELLSEELDYTLRYALVKAKATDYVRAAQVRLILQPIAETILNAVGIQNIAEKLRSLVAKLRANRGGSSGYAAANLLHLALQLNIQVEGWDFSRLAIWQADLRKYHLPATSFTQAHFANTLFMERFDAVLTTAFSPDGTLLAAGGASGNIHLWQGNDRELLSICHGHGRWIWALAFNPTSDLLASGGSDGMVRLWTIATIRDNESNTGGPSDYTLAGHTNTIFGLAFHPNGQILASASADCTIILWEIERKISIQTLGGHTATVYAVAFSPDGQWLASASRDRSVHLWQVATGQCVQVLADHQAQVIALQFSADGHWLVTATVTNQIQVYQVRCNTNGAMLIVYHYQTFDNDAAELSALALSPDGAIIAVNGPDTTIRLWQRAGGILGRTLYGHTENIQALAFHPNGKTLVSGGWDQSVRFWDVRTGDPLRTLQGYTNAVNSVALSPDGQTLVSGNADGTVCLWQGSPHGSGLSPAAHEGAVQSVAFHPDGQLLASGSSDCTIRLWQIVAGQLQERQTLYGHRDGVLCTRFSPDGKLLASSGADYAIRLWETRTGKLLQVLDSHTQSVQALVFSADGSTLFSGGDDGHVYRWAITDQIEAAQGSLLTKPNPLPLIAPLISMAGAIICLALSPDGAILAGAGPDHTVFLWRACDGQPLLALEAPVNSTIYAVAFRPSQASCTLQLASSSGTGALYFWEIDLATQQYTLRHLLSGHKGSVRSFQFTPDGQTLISGGADETIKSWAVDTGECIQTLALDQPYGGMNITATTGLSAAQRVTLKALGAFEEL